MYKCKDCNSVFDEVETKKKIVQVVDDWHIPYTDTFCFDCCPECKSEYIEDIEENI